MNHTRTLALFAAAGGLIAAAALFAFPAHIPFHPKEPIAANVPVAPKLQPVATTDQDPLIQVAILLDTSGSMEGLIEQAKSQLWKIVNELGQARRGGKTPRLEIALYEYGKSSLSAASGYAQVLVPFTTELDRISEALFALRTNGGEEYCGNTIERAMNELSWSSNRDALKMIFIAGNEPFNQGPIDPASAVRQALAKGIVVNTIYCGSDNGETAGWRQGAILAEGRFMTIDHNQQLVDVQAPQDAEIAKLGVEINGTYLPYGADGQTSYARQEAQDKNSNSFGLGNFSRRSASKGSAQYFNPTWDLVDAVKANQADLTKVDEQQLPEVMKKMTVEERKSYVETQAKRRGEIQSRIRQLSSEREKFVQAEQQKQAGAPSSLDVAMTQAVRGQASKHGFQFE